MDQATNLNDEPFLIDQLGRQTELLAALDTIVNAKPPLVIGVYGDWGTGKTSFMRALQTLLDKDQRDKHAKRTKIGDAKYIFTRADEIFNEHEEIDTEPDKKGKSKKVPLESLLTVWFNPWQHQFEKDPIFPLIDAVRREQASRWDKLTSRLKDIVEDPKFRIIGKATLGVMSMVGPGWFNALSRQMGDEAKEIMNRFNNFRQEFEGCLKELTQYQGGKLVIFIDDLDRCEARYTVRIFEALKLHLLNPHCIFVLGCARERVIKAVQDNITHDAKDAADYLDKIIQLPMHLPPIYELQLKGLLEALGRDDLASNDNCVKLLHTYAGDNPRKLKRFLMWHDLERRKVNHVKDLREKASMFFDDPSVFLKINLMRFVAPRHTVTLEQLMADRQGERRARLDSDEVEETNE